MRCGDSVCFHGSFSSKVKAERKAERVRGSVIRRRIRDSIRYVVLTPK